MKDIVKLNTQRSLIRLLTLDDRELVIGYFKDNKDHLIKYSPSLSKESFYTKEFWNKNIIESIQSFSNDTDCRLFIFLPDESQIIGSISFSNICRGPFQACNLGYGISKRYQGRGMMSEALKESINFMFSERNIHRVMANYIPSNKRSGDLLKRIGFSNEGLAKEYLYLNGQWQDHILTSLVNSNWKKSFIFI